MTSLYAAVLDPVTLAVLSGKVNECWCCPGGTVKGLAGDGLVLQNNGANGATIGRAANGTYPDLTGERLADGAAYSVTVKTQPANPSQTCAVTNGMGTIAGANITNI